MLIDESGGEDGTSDKPAKTLAFAIGTDIVVITLSVLLIVTQCSIIINDNGEICTSRPLYPKGDKSFRFSDSSFSAIGEINARMLLCRQLFRNVGLQSLLAHPWQQSGKSGKGGKEEADVYACVCARVCACVRVCACAVGNVCSLSRIQSPIMEGTVIFI